MPHPQQVAHSPTQLSLGCDDQAHLESVDVANFHSGFRARIDSANLNYILDKTSTAARVAPGVLWTKNSYNNNAIPGRWIIG